MPGADERNDRGGLHEINVAASAAEQSPRAVRKGGRRAQRHQRVHVRAANLELAPRTAVEPGAGQNLHRAREDETAPVEPPRHAKAQYPFPQHKRHCAKRADPQIQLPAIPFGRDRFPRRCFNHAGAVARLFDGLDDCVDILRRAGGPAH